MYIMPNRWIEHVRAFAAKNNMSYMCAMSDPDIKKGYIPTERKKQKTEKLEQAMPSTKPTPKNIVIKPRPEPAPAQSKTKKAPTKEPDEYIIGNTGGNKVYMTKSQLESQTTREIFIRMLRSNGAFKSQAADTKLYNKMKRADAREMSNILFENMDKVEYFTRQKFFKDFARVKK